jgi:hypothetical protein
LSHLGGGTGGRSFGGHHEDRNGGGKEGRKKQRVEIRSSLQEARRSSLAVTPDSDRVRFMNIQSATGAYAGVLSKVPEGQAKLKVTRTIMRGTGKTTEVSLRLLSRIILLLIKLPHVVVDSAGAVHTAPRKRGINTLCTNNQALCELLRSLPRFYAE